MIEAATRPDPDSTSPAPVEPFLTELDKLLGSELVAVYRFGSDTGRGRGAGQTRLLVLVKSIYSALLDKITDPISEARQSGLRVRLDTADNLLRGADAFPAFSLELLDHRQLLKGEDALAPLKVETKHLRLHIEHGLRGIYRDLVQAYLDAKFRGEGVKELRQSTRKLFFLLEGALIAAGIDVPKPAELSPILESVTTKLLDQPDEGAWKTLRLFAQDALPLADGGTKRLYGALFRALEQTIDVVDRLPDP